MTVVRKRKPTMTTFLLWGTTLLMLVVYWRSQSMILTILTSNEFVAIPPESSTHHNKNNHNNGAAPFRSYSPSQTNRTTHLRHTNQIHRVFVNFAFCHTADDRLDNLKFFLRHGVTVPHRDSGLTAVHYGLVVNGPCTDPVCHSNTVGDEQIPLRLLHRDNTGFDFGQHTAMLDDLDRDGLVYDAYIFLNAGVTGPFVPAYVPPHWHWVRGFTDKLVEKVGVVSTSIVCLPATDLGGFGPKIEAFAFALSAASLKIVRTHGTSFRQHRDKTAAILEGEYALTDTLFAHGMTIDSLLLAYQEVVWTPDMACNQLKHPSRHGSYFGTQLHPLETLFHKEVWANKPPVLGRKTFQTYQDFVDGKHHPTLRQQHA